MQQITTGAMICVKSNCLRLDSSLEGMEVNIENVADALSALCPEVSRHDRLQAIERMQKGISLFLEIEGKNSNHPDFIAEAMPKGMNEEQRKGWYLQWLQTSRAETAGRLQDTGSHMEISEIAKLLEEELRELTKRQMELMSYALTKEIAESIAQREENEHDAEAVSLANFPPLVIAASLYAASVNGDLPEELKETPELIGAASLARKKIANFAVSAQNGSEFIEGLLGVVQLLIYVASAIVSTITGTYLTTMIFLSLFAGMLGTALVCLVLCGIISLGLMGLNLLALVGIDALKERISVKGARPYNEVGDEDYYFEEEEEEHEEGSFDWQPQF